MEKLKVDPEAMLLLWDAEILHINRQGGKKKKKVGAGFMHEWVKRGWRRAWGSEERGRVTTGVINTPLLLVTMEPKQRQWMNKWSGTQSKSRCLRRDGTILSVWLAERSAGLEFVHEFEPLDESWIEKSVKNAQDGVHMTHIPTPHSNEPIANWLRYSRTWNKIILTHPKCDLK